MVRLTELSDGSGSGPAVQVGEQSSTPDPDLSSPSPLSDYTSETSVGASADDKLAALSPDGRYDPGITSVQSSDSSTASSLPDTPRVRNPPQTSCHVNGTREYGRRTRGSGRSQFNNLPPHGGPRLNGPRRNHFNNDLIRPGRYSEARGRMTQAQLWNMRATDWSCFRNVLVNLSSVPGDATTWDLYDAFQSYGHIVYIEFDENAKSQRTGLAKIRFEPPPKTPIQPGSRHWVTLEDRKAAVLIGEIRAWRNDSGVRSPLNNWVPTQVVLKPTTLSFGIMADATTFMQMRSVSSWNVHDELSVTVDFYQRKLKISFSVLFQDKDRPELPMTSYSYKLEGKFEIISKVHRVSNENTKSAVISLEFPPRLFRKKPDVQRTHTPGRLVWEESDVWGRVTEVTQNDEASRTTPACLQNNYHYIDIGRWMTYQLELDATAQDQWKSIEDAWMDWNIKTAHQNSMRFIPKAEPRCWSMLESIGSTPNSLAPEERVPLPFDVRYQLEVCISFGVIQEHNITRDFLLKLQELSAKKVQDQNRARLVLEYAADQKRRIFDPMSLFSDEGTMTYYPPCAHVPAHCAFVRKVTVTPTRIYFHTPTLETTNRVIRHYSHLQDNFLRITFMDELYDGRINGCDSVRDDELYKRVFRVMNQGIRMGRWNWQFLASGNSQMRENGAFFFCEEDGVTCDSIREWMGRFTHIKVTAKYAARLGQCFSTTRLLGNLHSPTIVTIPDVERNGCCFTDGVGKISPRLAKMIADEWKEDTVPSGFQFRMGGCKGVLVVWPDAKDSEVHIRKSQKKFSAEFNGLEIIRLSQYTTATLNLQIISILSCLGVPDEVFKSLLKQQVRDYDYAMKDRAFACKLLRQNVDESQTSVMIANMLDYGFMEANEPYVHAMLQLWKAFSLKYLKEKARIPIAESAFVLGCIDETATLKGHINKKRRRDDRINKDLPEIFLQISDPNNRGDPKIITGICIVGRNPSLHPGDIRVVMAVDTPALHHLRDVVVFPLQGDRDIPGMCSGGDLDGDDFFVIWNKKLIPAEWTFPPMNFEPAVPKELDHVPTIQELKVFFTMHMKNNSLPIIAHAHLAQADFRDSGAKDPRCIELAKLHSKAVDYVKTGVPAELDKSLLPRKYPHFMEKRNSYRSEKILGQMYDAVHPLQFHPHYEMPFDSRILKRYSLDPEMLKKARSIKTLYDTALKRIMGQLEIRTEFEALSAFVMSKPRVGTQYKLHEVVRRETDALKQQFKDTCVEAAGGSREFKVLAPFVAAMYQVTHEEVQIALHESRTPHIRKNGRQGLRQIKPESMPLISFPWLFDGILGKIATTCADGAYQGKQKALVAKEASPSDSVDAGVLETDYLQQMEYRRTDGGVFHRGQLLRLFHPKGEDDEAGTDEEEQEEIQQQPEEDDFVQPKFIKQMNDSPRTQSATDLGAGINSDQKQRSTPFFRQAGFDELNHGSTPARRPSTNPNKIVPGPFQPPPPRSPAKASDDSTWSSDQPDEDTTQIDLLTSSPPRVSTYPTLEDIEATHPRYVNGDEEEQQTTPTKKPTDARRGSVSVRAEVARQGFIPFGAQWDYAEAMPNTLAVVNTHLGGTDAQEKWKEDDADEKKKKAEEEEDEDEEDEDDDLEIEEVIVERKHNAFDILRKFAETDEKENETENENDDDMPSSLSVLTKPLLSRGAGDDSMIEEVTLKKQPTSLEVSKMLAGDGTKKKTQPRGHEREEEEEDKVKIAKAKGASSDPFAGLVKFAKWR